MTPKSEPAAVETKEELSEQGAGDQDSDTLREEPQRSRNEVPPHDSEDSIGPEHVADELRRLTAAHSQTTGFASTREPWGGDTAPDAAWENHVPYAPQRSRRNRVASRLTRTTTRQSPPLRFADKGDEPMSS